MTQHDDQRWVEPFQMTKVILQIMEKLQPLIEKIHQIQICYFCWHLSCLFIFQTCTYVNYFNAMRCLPFESLPSISCYISLFLQLMLCLKSKFNGHNGKIVVSDGGFKDWCNLLFMHGVINCTHSYSKIQWCFCCRLYYSYKSKAYNI